jgi:hypothetical protein
MRKHTGLVRCRDEDEEALVEVELRWWAALSLRDEEAETTVSGDHAPWGRQRAPLRDVEAREHGGEGLLTGRGDEAGGEEAVGLEVGHAGEPEVVPRPTVVGAHGAAIEEKLRACVVRGPVVGRFLV